MSCATKSFLQFSAILSFIHFFKMSNFIVECFCSLCYIKCEERFHHDDIYDVLEYLTYDFTGSKDIYNGFTDGEMGCSNHIDYVSLCLIDDDWIFRKSMKTYLDVVTGIELSEGFRVVLPSRLSVSTFLSLLHF
jgi:hypothetical protein